MLSMWLPKRESSLISFPESPRKYTGGSMSLDVLHGEMSAGPPEAGGWELRMLPPCSPHHHPPMPFRFLKMSFSRIKKLKFSKRRRIDSRMFLEDSNDNNL